MKKEHRNNLIKTAIFMLEHRYKLDMSWYQRDKDGICINKPIEINTCGTSCCFAGHAPMALGGSIGQYENWIDYVKRKFGVHNSNDMWEFLFDEEWPNNKNEAAARLIYMLRNGVPSFNNYNGRYAKGRTKAQLIKELEGLFV